LLFLLGCAANPFERGLQLMIRFLDSPVAVQLIHLNGDYNSFAMDLRVKSAVQLIHLNGDYNNINFKEKWKKLCS